MNKRPGFEEIITFLEEQVDALENNDGEIPSRATEIKAKKRNKSIESERLDVDTRLTTDDDGPSVKKFEQEVV
jgi:hypothetical protein